MSTTLFDKVWDSHVIRKINEGPDVLFIDRHLIHEVTSPQAFAELESRNLEIFRPQQIVCVIWEESRKQLQKYHYSDGVALCN